MFNIDVEPSDQRSGTDFPLQDMVNKVKHISFYV